MAFQRVVKVDNYSGAIFLVVNIATNLFLAPLYGLCFPGVSVSI